MKHTTRTHGLRIRDRHLLILFAYFAVLLGILVPALRIYGAKNAVNGSLVILLASPWLLGLLVLLVERKGPVKYWAAPLFLSLSAPALAISHNWMIVDHWRVTGAVPSTIISLLVNIIFVGSFSLFFARMYPDCCPRCGHRSLIPLIHLWNRSDRTPKTRWCGSCGAKYWRNREGLWQKERRSTWVDALIDETPVAGAGETAPAAAKRAESPYPAPRNPAYRPTPSHAGPPLSAE